MKKPAALSAISWAVLGISTVTIGLCISASATDLLKGHVKVEQSQVVKDASSPSTGDGKHSAAITAAPAAGSLVDRYGIAANSLVVAAAIRSAEATSNGARIVERATGAKAAADRYEALAHGHVFPGTDTTALLMAGYVTPGMSPQPAAIQYAALPNNLKMRRALQPGSPEWVSRMANEPIDPTDSLPQESNRASTDAANKKMFDGYMRARFGPVYVPPLHRDHDWISEHTCATPNGFVENHQVSAIPLQYGGGSIREMTDSSGNVVAAYGYDPYGRQTKISGAGPDADFGYGGYYVHQRSGLNLATYRAYNPAIGRWLNRDPVQDNAFRRMPKSPDAKAQTSSQITSLYQAATMGLERPPAPSATNLYEYVANDPIRWTDPSGLFADGRFSNIPIPVIPINAPPHPKTGDPTPPDDPEGEWNYCLKLCAGYKTGTPAWDECMFRCLAGKPISCGSK